MKFIYTTLRNLLLFFFLVAIFSGLNVLGDSFIDKFLVGLLFGLFMAVIPNILKFFKLPINAGSLILMGVITSFVFFFLSIYVFQIIKVGRTVINLGIGFIQDPVVVLQTETVALVFLSLLAALFSIGLELLSKKK